MVAGLNPINFRVCAGSLAVASPTWRKAISQTRLRATAQQMRVCKILRLPDDNPDALRIILQVIHYKFDALPDTISCETLFYTVMLCQKHGIQRLLKPFWNKWMKGVAASPALEPKSFVQQVMIAYTLDDLDLYTKTVKDFLCSAQKRPGHDDSRLFLEDFPNFDPYKDRHLVKLGVLGESSIGVKTRKFGFLIAVGFV
jgi:hypothetical protein